MIKGVAILKTANDNGRIASIKMRFNAVKFCSSRAWVIQHLSDIGFDAL